MDPVSLIVVALATGAAAALKSTAETAIKDAYSAFKTLIQRKYSQVNVALVESEPASKTRQDVVREDLQKSDAPQDLELLRRAQALLDTVQQKAPEAARVVGLDLEDLKAASASIKKIVAEGSGAVGIRIGSADVKGEFVVEDVQARDGAHSPNS